VKQWPSEVPMRTGRARWALLDEEGRRLGSGRFEILTPSVADSLRTRFEESAKSGGFEAEVSLGAALLAAAEHFYLW